MCTQRITYFSLPTALAVHGFFGLVAEAPYRQAVDGPGHSEGSLAPLKPDQAGSKQANAAPIKSATGRVCGRPLQAEKSSD